MPIKNYVKNLAIYLKNRKIDGLRISMSAILGLHNSYEGFNKIGMHTKFIGEIGYASYICDDCVISGKIGRYCSIGSRVMVPLGVHPTSGYVSTHPAFYSDVEQCGMSYVQENKFEEHRYAEDHFPVVIGNDVWIGNNVIIMPGVKIGNGAIVGAGAIVTRDIPPFAVAVGVPARTKSYRFTQKQIQFLNELRWWDKEKSWIQAHLSEFENIDVLIETIEGEVK